MSPVLFEKAFLQTCMNKRTTFANYRVLVPIWKKCPWYDKMKNIYLYNSDKLGISKERSHTVKELLTYVIALIAIEFCIGKNTTLVFQLV